MPVPGPLLASVVGDVHELGAWAVVVTNGAAGLWALAAGRWPRVRTPALWWATAVAELLVFAEVAAGVWLVAAAEIEVDQFHMFYGFLTLIAVAILYSYRQQLQRHVYWLYGGGGLFIMGLGLRAIFLGG